VVVFDLDYWGSAPNPEVFGGVIYFGKKNLENIVHAPQITPRSSPLLAVS